jgi:hypothetical protein
MPVDSAALPPALERASLSELHGLIEGYEASAKSFKEKAGRARAELARRYAVSAKEALRQQGKDHGTVTLALQDGFKIKCEAKQAVKWDSPALMAVAQTLPWSRVQQIFKIEFSIPEKIYAGLAAVAPEDMMAKIDAARMTKIGEPSITLEKEEPLA